MTELSKIWEYTVNVWSESQADKYYGNLLSSCQDIAVNLNLGKLYDEITPNLRGFKANKHIISYRTINKVYIEIT